MEGKLEIVPRRVGSGSFTKQRGMGTISISGRVLSEAHVREREAGRGAAVEEARTLMEKMRMEERQQQQGWSRERKPVESGPRPYSGRVENLKDWEEGGRKRDEGGWRAPGGVGRPSSTLTLDSFLLPEGPRPVKGRGGGKKGMMLNPGTSAANYRMDENTEWNDKDWSTVKSTVVGADKGSRPMSKAEPTPCKATCYWRSQDSTDGPTQVKLCCDHCQTIIFPGSFVRTTLWPPAQSKVWSPLPTQLPLSTVPPTSRTLPHGLLHGAILWSPLLSALSSASGMPCTSLSGTSAKYP